MKLIFATQNENKLSEVQHLLGNTIEIISLANLNFFAELPETHFTLRENAGEKALFVNKLFNADCFAEDTGLHINSLNGAPGVFSARYSGEQKSAADNINKVLQEMKGIENRTAYFKTVICLIAQNQKFFFEGVVQGAISQQPRGSFGFGYDPIFIPEGSHQTLAEINLTAKNEISHRKKAFIEMKSFWNNYLDKL